MATLQGSISILFTAVSDQLEKTIQAVNTKFVELKGSVDNLARASKNVEGLNVHMETLKQKAKDTIPLFEKSEAQLKSFRKEAEGIYFAGLHLGMIGAALTTIASIPVSGAAKFEKAMSNIAAVTENAAMHMDTLTKAALQMGSTTQFTAVQAAEGLFILGKAGLNATESIRALGPALYLAVTGEMELAAAADVAVNTMRAMQLEITDIEHITDVFANTANKTTAGVKDLSEAMKYAAPPAAAAGLSIDQLSALLGVLANNGIQASLAGTSLRGMLASLVAPSAKAKDTLDRLGVSVKQNEDGGIDLIQVLTDLGKAQMTLSEANAIFDRRSAASALALSKQIDTVKDLTRSNAESTGAAQEMARVMQENVIGASPD